MPLDDLDPYRVPHHPDQPGFTGITDLDDLARKRWGAAWSGAAAALGHGGPHRISEAVTLLRCLVPLAPPGGGAAGSRRRAVAAGRGGRRSAPC
ncbi:hypothetical protein OIM90_08320 [Streptomyces sp. AD16]|nr:hypothetical protein OIM90_08320 [Streptomyces sp. AD16]